MLRDKAGITGTVEMASASPSGDGSTRRRNRRRKLRFGRGGVLKVDGRSHIVAVVDLSVGGAYLGTRTTVEKAKVLVLNLRLSSGVELSLPCEVLRINQDGDESQAHPRGIAVRFHDLDENTLRHLEEFIAVDDTRRNAS
jgi:hypothetical protein